MMKILARLSHGFFVIEGDDELDIPDFGETIDIVSSSNCILVPCQHEQEGFKHIEIYFSEEILMSAPPVFDGHIQTHRLEVKVSNVAGEILGRCSVFNDSTRIRIWRNRPNSPTLVKIGLG